MSSTSKHCSRALLAHLQTRLFPAQRSKHIGGGQAINCSLVNLLYRERPHARLDNLSSSGHMCRLVPAMLCPSAAWPVSPHWPDGRPWSRWWLSDSVKTKKEAELSLYAVGKAPETWKCHTVCSGFLRKWYNFPRKSQETNAPNKNTPGSRQRCFRSLVSGHTYLMALLSEKRAYSQFFFEK